MPQDKRKSKRHFSLEKPVERRFDIEKDDVESNGSGIVTATNGSINQQPTGQSTTTSPNPAPNPTPDPTPGTGKKWIAAALAAGLIGGGAYYLWPSGSNGNPTDTEGENQPKVAQIAKIDVNGDGVVDINDDPTADTNGDGIIDLFDAVTDTNGDGVIDDADAAIADSNGDGVINAEDKSSGEMLKEKNIAENDVDNSTMGDKSNTSDASSNTDDNGKASSAVNMDNNDYASETSSPAQESKTGSTSTDANPQTQTTAGTNQASAGTKEPSNVTRSTSGMQTAQSTNTPVILDENPDLSLSVHELALKAIRGEFGTNPDRRRILGKSYKKVQREVNRIYRQRHYKR